MGSFCPHSPPGPGLRITKSITSVRDRTRKTRDAKENVTWKEIALTKKEEFIRHDNSTNRTAQPRTTDGIDSLSNYPLSRDSTHDQAEV